MIEVSQEYLTAINDYSRQMKTRVYFNDSEVPIEKELIYVAVTETGMSDRMLKFGDMATNKVEVKFYMPQDTIPLDNGYLRVEHGLFTHSQSLDQDDFDGYEYVPMGTFYIDEIQKSHESSIVSITGYDCTVKLKQDYKPDIEYPNTLENVVMDICQQCHVSINEYDFPEIIIDSYYEGTCQEMLSFIASLLGKCIKANRYDSLEFYWWQSTNYKITHQLQYLGEFKRKSDNAIIIHSLISGTVEKPLVSGEGYGMSFTNPYMIQTILDELLLLIQGLSYMPCEVKYRGNPAIEIGDMINVEDKNGNFYPIVLSEHTIVLTGLNAKINCEGEQDNEISMGSSFIDHQLKKLYHSLQTSFKESTETIIGEKGGYFIIDRDDQGFPAGFKIMDTPTLTEYTKGWLFNKNGFGYSDNGFQTLQNVAIDMLGHINANAIHTGIIQGNCFDIDLESGSIVMGKRGEDGEFIHEWFRVDINGIYLSVSEQIHTDIDDINQSIDNIEKSIIDNQTELRKYIRWNQDYLEMGEIGTDNIQMKLTNQKLAFLQSGQEVAYISNNKLYITEGLFMNRCVIGHEDSGYYEWIIRTNGNMSLKYREVNDHGE